MSNNVEVEITPIEVSTPSSVSVTGMGDVPICVEKNQEVTVQKKEYSIVGDALYATVNTDEAPEWLTSIIDSLIDLQIAGSLADLDDLRASIILALSELEVAKNQYEELINIEETIDRIITSRLTTLNASMDQANANIITLQLTTVTPTQAAAIAATQITSSLNDGAIKSAINEVAMTVTSLDETVANMYLSLVSAIEGVGEASSEVEVLANVLKDRLEASWSYNAKLLLADGRWYRSGFGLNTSVQTGGDGSEGNPYLSEFWINAQRFKFTNTSMSGTVTPFTIDASGATPAITFTGNVVINNRGNAVSGGIPVFLGSFNSPPTAIVRGDTYKNTANGIVYTWDGTVWTSTAGADGDDGKGVSSTVVNYQASTSGTVAPTGTWLSTIPTVPNGQYLWTRTIFSYTDSTQVITYAVARQGENGANGSNGVGIATSQVHYQAGVSGTVIPTDTWSTSIPSVPAGWYLWTRTTLTFTNGSTQISYSVSRQGMDGSNGSNGANGTRGAGFFRIGTPTGTWDNAVANSALPDGIPVKDDIVTIYQISNPGTAVTRMWSGSAWVAPALAVHGNMIVDGTIAGQKLIIGTIQGQHIQNGSSTTGITAVKFNDWLLSDTQPNGNPTTGAGDAALALNFRTGDAYLRNIFARGDIEASSMKAGSIFVGGTIQSVNFNPANPTQAGWRISSDGSAIFNGIVLSRPNVVAQGTLNITGSGPHFANTRDQLHSNTVTVFSSMYNAPEYAQNPNDNTWFVSIPAGAGFGRGGYYEFQVNIPTSTFSPDEVGAVNGRMLVAQAVVVNSTYQYTGASPEYGYETPCTAMVTRVANYGVGGSYIQLRIQVPMPFNKHPRITSVTINSINWALSSFT